MLKGTPQLRKHPVYILFRSIRKTTPYLIKIVVYLTSSWAFKTLVHSRFKRRTKKNLYASFKLLKSLKHALQPI
jgi:hypothetical protein